MRVRSIATRRPRKTCQSPLSYEHVQQYSIIESEGEFAPASVRTKNENIKPNYSCTFQHNIDIDSFVYFHLLGGVGTDGDLSSATPLDPGLP